MPLRRYGAVSAVLVAMSLDASAATIFVDQSASGANNGSTWTDAYQQLQPALDAASSGDEVWIAGGLYAPAATPSCAHHADFATPAGDCSLFAKIGGLTYLDTGSTYAYESPDSGAADPCPHHADIGAYWDGSYCRLYNEIPGLYYFDWSGTRYYRRFSSFHVSAGVKVYGGFDGTENALSQRNAALNATYLSGDIGNDDDTSNDAAHVVVISEQGEDVANQVVLDGLRITEGGKTGDFETEVQNGAGLFVFNSNVLVHDVQITDSRARGGGGAVYVVTSSNAIFDKVYIADNKATGAGGGIFIASGLGSNTITFTDSIISGNFSGGHGGGVTVASGTVSFVRTTFDDNRAGVAITTGDATNPRRGGAISVPEHSSADVTVEESAFSNNRSEEGLGGAINQSGPNATLTISESEFVNNIAGAVDGGGDCDGTVGGGAIAVSAFGTGAVRATVTDSLLLTNTSLCHGGGIFVFNSDSGSGYVAELDLVNTTLFGNSTSMLGGGIGVYDGTATIAFSTIYGNVTTNGSAAAFPGHGAGLSSWGGVADVDIKGNVILGNTNSSTGDAQNLLYINGAFNLTDRGYNIVGEDGAGGIESGYPGTAADASILADATSGVGVATAAVMLNVALADYSGPTRSLAVRIDSELRDAVPSANCEYDSVDGSTVTMDRDQRGFARPDASDSCDIGAVEYTDEDGTCFDDGALNASKSASDTGFSFCAGTSGGSLPEILDNLVIGGSFHWIGLGLLGLLGLRRKAFK